MKIKAQKLAGFRDFLPEEARKRECVINTIKSVFTSYGFEPLETPAIEYAETLLGKYGDEADKLIYQFKDRGGREVGLRYDLTVPLARVIASSPNLPMPFKRYQIQPVWRADKPQAGRYREFLQCDADIVGTTSLLADAEVIATAVQSLNQLGFKDFKILINDRKSLMSPGYLVSSFDISSDKIAFVLRSIDKIDKIGELGVEKEIIGLGFNQGQAKEIISGTKKAEKSEDIKTIEKYLQTMGINENQYEFAGRLVRGLDYYTGMIFEVIIKGYTTGSIAGGGRYDGLIGKFIGKDIPAVGFSFGIDRLIEAMEQQGLFKNIPSNSIKVLLTVFSPELFNESLKLVTVLRNTVTNVEIYPDPNVKLDKQLKYADKKGIPYVVIIGPDEISSRLVNLKNMEAGSQEKITMDELVKRFSTV